ncbi:hypothetical protein KI387_028163 [Taxus chinensis]|uniref:Inositol-3-phosphate synthase n=1 Tax=Taxus chinensis TaxID=29808 RepID=A0AA38L327_TAXCH|nr:hypothetical protein KI387_028163 [Taxus chinensis]
MPFVFQYVPYVGDSKRAMDEYTSEIFMGGKSTIVLHNTCEDSLLAAPLILDLVLLAELSTRIQLKKEGEAKFHSFHPVATILSYLTKAPMKSIVMHFPFTLLLFPITFSKLIKEELYNDKIPNDQLIRQDMDCEKRAVMNPKELRFTQPDIAPYFRNPTLPSVEDAVTLIRQGRLDPAVFGDLTVHRDRDGVVWCENNRSLYVLRKAGIKSVKVKLINNDFRSRCQDKTQLNDPAFMPSIRGVVVNPGEVKEETSNSLAMVGAVSGAVATGYAAWKLFNLFTQSHDDQHADPDPDHDNN